MLLILKDGTRHELDGKEEDKHIVSPDCGCRPKKERLDLSDRGKMVDLYIHNSISRE